MPLLLLFMLISSALYAVEHEVPGALIDVGGYRMHIACEGYGTPTVLVDVGLGGNSLEWRFVVDEVRQFTRVCFYDRAGYGHSDMGPRPRTSSRISDELYLLTESLGLDRPFFVGGALIRRIQYATICAPLSIFGVWLSAS